MKKVQNALFDLGALLACPSESWEKFKLQNLKPELIALIEEEIDAMQSELDPLKNFILPGGSVSASHAHLCRTICRRVERKLIAFEEEHKSEVPENSKEFLNRLSDYFFVLARRLNKENNVEDELWEQN